MNDCIKIRRRRLSDAREDYITRVEGAFTSKFIWSDASKLDFSAYIKVKEPSKKYGLSLGREKCSIVHFIIQEKAPNNDSDISKEKEIEFYKLAQQWAKEAKGQSSMSQALTPTYLKILTLGKEITPLILKELKERPNFWFLALRTLNDENPVPKEHMGNVLKMREAWLTWGEAKRLI